jgi:hypothetical protein
MQKANNKVAKARAARLPKRLRSPGIEVGRNVVSTCGALGLAVKSEPALVFLSERNRAALCNKSETSSSEGATRTASGSTTTTSQGSSIGFEGNVGCIGAP